jgi:hypothetical protein
MGSMGIFRLVVFFDDDEESNSYTEQVDHCPRCGLWLHALDIKPSEVTWLESAMRHAFTQGRPELWAYLEAVMDEVLFEMELTTGSV